MFRFRIPFRTAVVASSACFAAGGWIGAIYGEPALMDVNDFLKGNIPNFPTIRLPSVAEPGASQSATSPVSSAVGVVAPTNRTSEIMKFGFPSLDNVRTYDNHVISYDKRNRTANWVFEHLTPERLIKQEAGHETADRTKCDFKEDKSMHIYFRATNEDYKASGYDRGHLAAAGNHKHSQKAMENTFLLSNISPQVGKGFNRGAWSNLEKFVRSLARKNKNVYVCTGPLYLPRKDVDGKLYVKYEVIGRNHVSVPTHFFKVVVLESASGGFELLSFVLPNQALSADVPLKNFLVPLETIERASGLLFFEKMPKKQFKLVNSTKVS